MSDNTLTLKECEIKEETEPLEITHFIENLQNWGYDPDDLKSYFVKEEHYVEDLLEEKIELGDSSVRTKEERSFEANEGSHQEQLTSTDINSAKFQNDFLKYDEILKKPADEDFQSSTPKVRKPEEEEDRLMNPYKCIKCSYQAKSEAILKRHLEVVHNMSLFLKCSNCDFKTKWIGNLKKHQNVHTQKNTLKREYKCLQCDYETDRKEYLRKHIKKHSKLKEYKCSKCDYETHRKDCLKPHIERHSTLKEYKCSQCSYETHDKNYFWKHFRNHNPKEYKCLQYYETQKNTT